MSVKAIAFLGYTKPGQPYRETTYRHEGIEFTTPFMAEATATFFADEIDELLVLVTLEAREQNFDDFAARFTGHIQPRAVNIPSGKDESELWKIFTIIANEVQPGDTIVFDITNGFRSLPVLALLATAYLRVARGAIVRRMVYGAFEATDAHITPVFDLTPFLALLDWSAATDALLRYGRADQLHDLVLADGSLGNVHAFAGQLNALTDALQTSRPAEVLTTAHALTASIASISATTHVPQAQPFTLLLDQVRAEFAPLAFDAPQDIIQARETVARHAQVIRWYLRKGMYIQALTLAREWVVSVVVAECGGNLYEPQRNSAERNDRQYAEAALNGYDTLKASNGRAGERIPRGFATVGKDAALQALWKAIRVYRNDIAHTGMSLRAEDSMTIIKGAQQLDKYIDAVLTAFQYTIATD